MTHRVLPTAPTDVEKYSYLGPQMRHLVVGQTVVSVGISAVLTGFFLKHPVLWPFVAVTVLNIVYAAISAFTGLRTRRVDLPTHVSRVQSWKPANYPSVDVFLPSCGEPLEILRNTYEHVARLAWPGSLRVLVLDDAGRPEVAELAGRFGFDYRSRPDRGHMKKAGNLAYGFRHSAGDVIAVFDADFCPRADFLTELMPYLDDPKTGIVQSPQYFTTHASMNWLQQAAASVQEIFYRWVQPSRDALNGAICVGTSALYRRSSLEKAGGFAQIGHSEDVHTGVKLMRAGYATRYVPVVVSSGLCPDNLAAFLSQQYRWCAGSLSLLTDRSFWATKMTLSQRLCFATGFFYYISTAVTLFGGPAAAIALVWLLPHEVWAWMYLPLIVASWSVFAAWKVTARSRWDLSVVRVQMLYSAAHALAIVHALRGTYATWVPTGSASKGLSVSTQIYRLVAGWIVLVQVALWPGVLRGLVEHGIERFWLSALLTLLGTAIAVPMLRPLREGRADDRAGGAAPRTDNKFAGLAWVTAATASVVGAATML